MQTGDTQLLSRRKQLKPAKLNQPNPQAMSPPVGTIKTEVKEKDTRDTDLIATFPAGFPVIKKGACFGPYSAKQLTITEAAPANAFVVIVPENAETVTKLSLLGRTVLAHAKRVTDSTGKFVRFKVDDELFSKWLGQLSYTRRKQDSNCCVTYNGRSLHVEVTEETTAIGTLVAFYRQLAPIPPSASSAATNAEAPVETQPPKAIVKKYACDRCNVASFQSKRNLDAHQTYYCLQKEDEQTQPSNHGDVQSLNVMTLNEDIRQPSSTPTDRPMSVGESSEVRLPAMPPTSLPVGVAAPTFTDTPNSLQLTPSPNVILLPVAYSARADAPRYAVIGQPQLVIPVAVPRLADGTPPASGALILEQSWMHNCVHIPAPTSVAVSGLGEGFSLPLAVKPDQLPSGTLIGHSFTPKAPSGASSTAAPRKADRRHSQQIRPLDLTVKRAASHGKRTPTPNVKSTTDAGESGKRGSAAPGVDRPFVCMCGISFSSVQTLKGHQQFYCRDKSAKGAGTSDNADSPDTAAQKPTSTTKADSGSATTSPMAKRNSTPTLSPSNSAKAIRCQSCEYTATTANQMTLHLRSAHATIHGYLCKLCGYRGYSIRGMKSHLRTHSELADVKELTTTATGGGGSLDQLLFGFVSVITAVSESAATQQQRSPSDRSASSTPPKKRTRVAAIESSATPSPSSAPSAPPRPALLCPECAETFTAMEEYQKHSCATTMMNAAAKEVTSQEKYQCPLCDYSTPYKGNMKRHSILIHKLDPDEGIS